MDNTTYAEFAPIPSAGDDPFRSIKAEVSTEVDSVIQGRWAEMDADFFIADGHTISSFGIGVSGFVTGPNVDQNGLVEDVGAARRDLEFFKAQFDTWYAEAHNALEEFAKEAGLSV